MFIVRFPGGVSITYNDANFLRYQTAVWELYTKDPAKGGQWVASVSPAAGIVLEAIPACKIENPVEKSTHEQAMRVVTNNIRSFNRSELRRLKKELAAYRSRYGTWQK